MGAFPAPPLPSLVARPNTLALFGDSYVSRTTNGGNGLAYDELSFFVPANVMMGWPFQIVGISGHSGFSTSDLLGLTQHSTDPQQNYLATDILSLSPLPKYTVISAGTNDPFAAAPLTLSQSIANLKTIITGLQGAGITPILMSPPPRNSMTGAQLLQFTQLLRWEREYCLQNSILFVDMFHTLAHPNTGSFLAAGEYGALLTTTTEGVHPSAYGDSLISEAIMNELGAYLPNGYGAVSATVVGAGTSGFAVGDLLTTTGGDGTPATLQVATLSGSTVATVTAVAGGALASVPQNPVTMTTSTGSGVGTVTLNVTWQNIKIGYPSNLPSGLRNRMSRLSLGGDTINIDIAYDATYAPSGNIYGNLIKNGMMLGVAGTNSFADGQAATNWTVTTATVPTGGGGAILFSKVPHGNNARDRGYWQQATITGGSPEGGGIIGLQSAQDVSSANSQSVWSVGDVIYAQMEFELDALNYAGVGGAVANTPPILQVNFMNGASLISSANCFVGQTATNVYRMPSGVCRTPNVAIPVGTTRMFVAPSWRGNGTVRFGNIELRKVITL